MTTAGLPADALGRAIERLPGDSLRKVRQRALERFSAQGFPTTRDEDWKYTDLADVIDISRRWLQSEARDAAVDAAQVRAVQAAIDADWIVIANGRIDRALSTGIDAACVEIGELEATAEDVEADEPLSALNLALLAEGLSLKVTGDRHADRPIGLLIADADAGSPTATQVRIDIAVTANAGARFVEYQVSTGNGEHYSNSCLSMNLASGARVDYVRMQDRSPAHSQTARLNVRLDRDSTFRHCGFDLGGRLVRNDLHIDIAGEGASATFDGLYIAATGQHIDNHTRIDHRVGPAASMQEYRGILDGRCRAVWNGKAIVHSGADGTDANQANHNLLLSERAEIDAKPELEIYADEVKCAHGTTVGELDEKALFYLRTRGLDKARAKRVLTRAFAATVVNKSPLDELHELIGDRVEQRLRELAQGSSR